MTDSKGRNYMQHANGSKAYVEAAPRMHVSRRAKVQVINTADGRARTSPPRPVRE